MNKQQKLHCVPKLSFTLCLQTAIRYQISVIDTVLRSLVITVHVSARQGMMVTGVTHVDWGSMIAIMLVVMERTLFAQVTIS